MSDSVLIGTKKGSQAANMVGRGSNKAAADMIRQLLGNARGLQQVAIGSIDGTGSSANEVIQTNWRPDAVVLFRALGSGVYVGHDTLGDGKAFYIRGNASVPSSMGLIASLGIYMQSNGFGLGSVLSVSGKSYGYIAYRNMPSQAAD